LDTLCRCGHPIYEHVVAEAREDWGPDWYKLPPLLKWGGCTKCRCGDQHLDTGGTERLRKR
jgi:hypothetical protein